MKSSSQVTAILCTHHIYRSPEKSLYNNPHTIVKGLLPLKNLITDINLRAINEYTDKFLNMGSVVLPLHVEKICVRYTSKFVTWCVGDIGVHWIMIVILHWHYHILSSKLLNLLSYVSHNYRFCKQTFCYLFWVMAYQTIVTKMRVKISNFCDIYSNKQWGILIPEISSWFLFLHPKN